MFLYKYIYKIFKTFVRKGIAFIFKIIYNDIVSYLQGGYMKAVSKDASKDKALTSIKWHWKTIR